MNRSSAILLLCAAGASIHCSQAAPVPSQGPGGGATSTAGAGPGAGGSSGSATTAGATGTTAGAPGTGGGDAGGAAPAGGASGGGAPPAGGATGTAGAGGATGTAGAGGGSGGGAVTPADIVPTLDGFLWVGTCGDAASTTKDCPIGSTAGTSCVQTGTDFYALGAFQTHTHKVGGTPGTKYMISFDARGITGGKTYNSGTKQSTDLMFNQTGNDGWYAGGLPTPTKWNTYEIHVSPPVPGVPVNTQKLTCTGCPPVPDNVYYTNSLDGADMLHETFPIKFSASFPVLGGGTITLVIHDSNCLGQQNCGPNPDQAAMCDAPRTMDLTGLGAQPPAGFTQPYTQAHNPNPWHPQWLLFDVKSVTAQ
jgi:hypothetical protein